MKTIVRAIIGIIGMALMMTSVPVLAHSSGGCQIKHLHGKGCSYSYAPKKVYKYHRGHHVKHHHSRACHKNHKPKCYSPCARKHYNPCPKKCVLKRVRKPVCKSMCPDYRTGAHIRVSRTTAYQDGFDAGCRTASTGHMYKNPKLHSYNAHYQLGWEAGVNQCHYNRTHINTGPQEFAVIPY